MSNDTTQILADVRERVAKIVREAMEDARRSERLNTFPQSSMWDYADRILALLRTPRGEGEAMDADAMWYHWSSGHEVAALQGLRAATDDEAHRFLSMLADWQRCPMPSDHDVAAALRSGAQGEDDRDSVWVASAGVVYESGDAVDAFATEDEAVAWLKAQIDEWSRERLQWVEDEEEIEEIDRKSVV